MYSAILMVGVVPSAPPVHPSISYSVTPSLYYSPHPSVQPSLPHSYQPPPAHCFHTPSVWAARCSLQVCKALVAVMRTARRGMWRRPCVTLGGAGTGQRLGPVLGYAEPRRARENDSNNSNFYSSGIRFHIYCSMCTG